LRVIIDRLFNYYGVIRVFIFFTMESKTRACEGLSVRRWIQCAALETILVVRYCTKDGIDVREGVRPCLGPVPFRGSSREEKIIVIRVVHMELVRADANYWTT
jgi:hypothetical protein